MRTLSSSQGSHVTPHQGLIKLGWARDTARPPHSNYGPLALSFPILLFQSSSLPSDSGCVSGKPCQVDGRQNLGNILSLILAGVACPPVGL